MSLLMVTLASAMWFAPVELPVAEGPWVAASVPGWLEADPGLDQGRVRLLEADGDEVPYRLLDRLASGDGDWLAVPLVNLRRTGEGFRFAVELPAGELIDRLRLALDGTEGVLAATVRAGEPSGVLVEGIRVGRLQGASVVEIELPPVDLTRLEVELAELLRGLEPVGVSVRRARMVRRPEVAQVEYRLRAAPDVDHRTRFLLAADGPPPRIDALLLEVAGPGVFRRQAVVHDRTPGEGAATAGRVGSAELVRLPLGDGRPGLETLVVPLRPGSWPRLELEIERGAEAPLELVAARGRAAPRWMLFPHPGRTGAPLRLVNGGSTRVWSLERGPLRVDLRAVPLGGIGSPAPAAEESGPAIDAGAPWVSLLFVLVAALLGWFAWRVFASGGRG